MTIAVRRAICVIDIMRTRDGADKFGCHLVAWRAYNPHAFGNSPRRSFLADLPAPMCRRNGILGLAGVDHARYSAYSVNAIVFAKGRREMG